MSRYYSYIDTTVGLGSTTVSDMLSGGSEYGVVPSIDIVARNITATGDFETSTASSGLFLTSPNGTRYRLTVDDSGNLTTTAV